ncbi:uncharacterized protein LOC133806824 [Humulus lupulus]|uniref:uncharacterized protein LOC133806824 n=1 Tax=Humulus lupulus TaxID=3486 RepID=UPI002B40712A|nr:uncharacterized protein LOC133806824 [Humulus lupulus]
MAHPSIGINMSSKHPCSASSLALKFLCLCAEMNFKETFLATVCKRATKEYENGAREFVKTTIINAGFLKKIICLCNKCQNLRHQLSDEVVEHLVVYGMDKSYKTWFHHGEDLHQNSTTNIRSSNDVFQTAKVYSTNDVEAYSTNVDDLDYDNSDEDFNRILLDAESPLYEGCLKYTELSSIVGLYNLKTKHGFSDIKAMLPEDNLLLTSMYAVNKFLKKFNLNYKHVHTCVNDCCLFTKENIEAQECPKCNSSRWKQNVHTNEILLGQPTKLLRYFPITPRLQRMFRSKETSTSLKWHFTNKSTDGKMCHPVDSEAWDAINERWPDFSLEPNNLRLGLAADGINPYKSMSFAYSCWPVMLIVYNLPPLCLKDEFTFLYMLIPGPKKPRNEIDVYLEPLIDELLELWNGVYAYDASTKKIFNLRHSKKMSYCNHTRFLPTQHRYRRKKYTSKLSEKASECPTILTGKSKDHYESRLYLEEMGIMTNLHPYKENGIIHLPSAAYTLSKVDKKLFCKRLFDLKLPYGYSSNISNCVDVEKRKLTGLKSHDYHVIMQQLLVVAIKGLMEEGCRVTILQLSKFFYGLCQRVVDNEEIIKLEFEAVEIL